MKKQNSKTTWESQTIRQALEKHREELQRRGVCKIGLLGSYRQDRSTLGSDMNFLVVLEKPSFDTYMDVKFFLEDLFGCAVDLVLEETIKPRLRPYILEEVFYTQPQKFYLEGILAAIPRIEGYIPAVGLQDFEENTMLTDAVLGNLEIIGNAAKNVPGDMKARTPEVEWRKIAGRQDIIATNIWAYPWKLFEISFKINYPA